jgi:phosphopantothenate-cysteine ligase
LFHDVPGFPDTVRRTSTVWRQAAFKEKHLMSGADARPARLSVVVTGGGTIAPVDDVRLLTNVSSGRFAAAITEACLERSAAVWHIHSPPALLPFVRSARFELDAPDPAAEVDRLARLREKWLSVRDRLHLVPLPVGTVADYQQTLKRVVQDRSIDIAFLTMAVSDFEPEPRAGKISSEAAETLVIHCKRTPKVIRSVRDWSPSIYLVGFKLLSGVSPEVLIRQAESACHTNRAQLTVANDLELIRQGRHTLHLVRPGFEPETLPPGDDLADRLVDRVFTWARAAGDSMLSRPPSPARAGDSS